MKNNISKILALTIVLFPIVEAIGQVWTGNTVVLNHPTLGANGDYTAIYRADEISDRTVLRFMMGDEYTSDLQIGYTNYQNGQWQSNFTLDGYGNTYVRGNIGIGTTSAGAKLSFNNLNDGSNLADGITWYNPAPLVYGIYRTPGAWSSPNYQQLKLSFDTGIILDPGSAYGKSYVDVQGAGLRVSSGNVGIGTLNPDFKLTVNGKIKAEEIQVVVDVPADYVFEKDYSLMPLQEVEKFVTENKHLPGMPDAQSLITNGWQVGAMNNKLLEKIEELTLYLIALKKENEELKKRVEKIEKK